MSAHHPGERSPVTPTLLTCDPTAELPIKILETICIETGKNVVEIHREHVLKRYKNIPGAARRCRREAHALRRLIGIDGIPVVMEQSEKERVLVTSRIPGVTLASCGCVPDTVFRHLRDLVSEMMRRGIARHSIPFRDVIVRPDGRAGLVDFERTTRCRWRYSPVWVLACAITNFHLLRLIANHAPHLITPAERRRLRIQWSIRNAFRRVTKPSGRRAIAGYHCGAEPFL